MQIEWFTEVPGKEYGLVITEPVVGSISSTLSVDIQNLNNRSLYIDMFEAGQPGNGVGKRLVQLAKADGEQYGATEMSGHFISRAALGAFIAATEDAEPTFTNKGTGEQLDISVHRAMEAPEYYVTTAHLGRRP